MELSTLFLHERLELMQSASIYFNKHGGKFSNVMLYTEDAPLEDGVLYVHDGAVESLRPIPKGAGVVHMVDSSYSLYKCALYNQLPYDSLVLFTPLSAAQVLNGISHLFAKLRTMEQRFVTSAQTEHNVQKLIEMLYDFFQNPAYLVDASFRVLAVDRRTDLRNLSQCWKQMEDEGFMPFRLVGQLINSGELHQMETAERTMCVNSQYFGCPFLNYNLVHEHSLQGHLFIVGRLTQMRASDVELADYLGQYVLHAMVWHTYGEQIPGNYYQAFMQDLLMGKPIQEGIIGEQMEFLGYREEDYYTVLVVRGLTEQGNSQKRIANQLERVGLGKPVFCNGTSAVLYAHGRQAGDGYLKKRLRLLTETIRCQIGVSHTFQGYRTCTLHYTQAAWVASLELEDCSIRHFGDYAADYCLHRFQSCENLEILVHPAILQLKKLDEDGCMELVKTLRCYLERERAILETADFLHIHRNTLSYRIQKILTLCNLDLDELGTRKQLLLGISAIDEME